MRRGDRRAVLAAIAFANMVVSALAFGLAAAGPVLRLELGIGEAELGVLLAATSAGLMVGTFAWGVLADRRDERSVLVLAFVGFSTATAAAAGAGGLESLTGMAAALVVAGACGSAAHSAGGRTISAAWPPERHGLVLGIRHGAIPVGGAIGGVLLPWIGRTEGLGAALGIVAALGLIAAAAIGVGLPGAGGARASGGSAAGAAPDTVAPLIADRSPLHEPALWLLGLGCGCLAFTQLGIGAFLTLQLVDEGGLGIGAASGIYAAAQLTGAVTRISLGIASDRLASRAGVLRGVALGVAAILVVVVLQPSGPLDGLLLVAAFVVATSWNGVAVAAAAQLAPAGRTGATLGMQTTLNALAGTLAPVVLGLGLALGGWRLVELVLLVALAGSTTCLSRLAARAA